MRLVLHPKVYSDIDSIMDYYEQVARHNLRMNFMRSCELYSLIIFFFELSKTSFGFWLCDITVDIH
jgi:hypothetical protein